MNYLRYGWRGSEIGLALPFIFLSGVSLRFGVKSWGLSDANLFRVYASMGLVGSLLAGHPACTVMRAALTTGEWVGVVVWSDVFFFRRDFQNKYKEPRKFLQVSVILDSI